MKIHINYICIQHLHHIFITTTTQEHINQHVGGRPLVKEEKK